MGLRSWVIGLIMYVSLGGATVAAFGEMCTTQSQMKVQDRDVLVAAARDIAGKVQASDPAGLRGVTIAEFANNFGPLQNLVHEIAPKLAGGVLTVDQVYLLDGSDIKATQGGTEAQFFCSLNKSAANAGFLIPGLAPGVYGFAIVQVAAPTPWVIPILLRRDQGRWLLAGLYPHATGAAGHDGLWYWKEARRLADSKQPWSAWLYYTEAEKLLTPAGFIVSSHLEKLRDEQRAAAPSALSAGISKDVPLVVRGADGKNYEFTGLNTEDTTSTDKIEVSAHLRVDQIGDPAAARKRNEDAMRALVDAHPELRTSFHGIWVLAETAASGGQLPFATEQTMSDLH